MHTEYFGLVSAEYCEYSKYKNVLRNTVLRVVLACVLRYTASTRSFSRFSTADTSGHAAVSRRSILWILLCFKHSGLCTAGTAVHTGRISSIGSASSRSTVL